MMISVRYNFSDQNFDQIFLRFRLFKHSAELLALQDDYYLRDPHVDLAHDQIHPFRAHAPDLGPGVHHQVPRASWKDHPRRLDEVFLFHLKRNININKQGEISLVLETPTSATAEATSFTPVTPISTSFSTSEPSTSTSATAFTTSPSLLETVLFICMWSSKSIDGWSFRSFGVLSLRGLGMVVFSWSGWSTEACM